jgi:hypothetical protein
MSGAFWDGFIAGGLICSLITFIVIVVFSVESWRDGK